VGKTCFGRVELWVDGWWMGKKRSTKIIDIVSYTLEMSVNGVTFVIVVHFRLKKNI